MGRKRLITDSYPVLGEEPQPLSVDEAELELLRQFDLAWQYGPCTGITRLQRWHRAEQMGLEPPAEVRQVLQTHPGDPRFQYRTSGMSIPFEAPPKASCLRSQDLRTQAGASLLPPWLSSAMRVFGCEECEEERG
ncbi:DNA polymerase delta subunit 4 [Prionailurus iriomotensis]